MTTVEDQLKQLKAHSETKKALEEIITTLSRDLNEAARNCSVSDLPLKLGDHLPFYYKSLEGKVSLERIIVMLLRLGMKVTIDVSQ